MRALALAALTALTPAMPAQADAPEFGCRFQPVQQETATGSGYEVIAVGWVAHAADEDVSITCSVEVNGNPTTWTPTGTGTAVATTTGFLTYSASETDEVRGCATATVAGHPVAKSCPVPLRTQIPPREVVDVMAGVFDAVSDVMAEHSDPVVCALLASQAGSYGPVTIDGEGDVDVAGPFWDCPPVGG